MDAILYLIPPNDLETLILEAETPQDVLDSPFVQHSFFLGEAWQELNPLLSVNRDSAAALNYAIQAEHPLSERRPGLSLAVHYNTVVRVAEIHQALQQLSVDEIKKRYLVTIAETAPEQELKLAELKLLFLQLQDLYRDAARHNLSVLSVIQDGIRLDKLP
ncbi:MULTISPECIES: DUF1877 family protein [unclassified Acinetobacter]|uniref:DUF1877 family protein n=1 Tax=unclassified Acinetobacter TaxID=196816 RepID=UPI0015D2ECF7|nr:MULTISPECIES: DUF1877 family protein [unclassified Acinetobacter]